MHLWCRLIPQATTTLNLLRPSCINPHVSAEAILNGAFDYDKTPLAPPGTRVVVHETPSVRKTWAPDGQDGWYIVGAPKHYRCHRCYILNTRSERIACTVDFFPYLYDMPTTTSAYAARDAAAQLTDALLNPHPAAPFAPMAEAQLRALRQLAEIFTRTTSVETPMPISPPVVPPQRQQQQQQQQTVGIPTAPPRVITPNPVSHAPPRVQLTIPSADSPRLLPSAPPRVLPTLIPPDNEPDALVTATSSKSRTKTSGLRAAPTTLAV